ncbi:MAG: hypothetical protein V4620_05490 [Bacteroidota bacterium]
MQSSTTTKIVTILLTGIFIISCGQTTVSNHKDENQLQGVDSVTVYQNDPSDSIPKNKIIYQTACGNTPDSLKPKFNINFCNDHFRFPYYFPDWEQLTGQAGQTNIKIENKHLQANLRSAYTMTYNKDGMITNYAISGPSTIYSASFVYDNQNRIEQIADGWKKINITYNDFNNIETLTELNSAGQTNKTLRFTYTYVTFPRN